MRPVDYATTLYTHDRLDERRSKRHENNGQPYEEGIETCDMSGVRFLLNVSRRCVE